MQTSTLSFSLEELPDIDRYLSLASDIAFVSGSQQVGLGNRTSDFDLYIVYSEEMERLRDGPKQFWLQDPDRRVDMERHSAESIAAATARLNAIDDPTPASVGHIPFDVFDLYYRTLVGVPLANAVGFGSLTAAMDADRYNRVFAAWSFWQAGCDLAQARQLLEQDRKEAAYLRGRLAMRQTVTGWMARLGYGWPNPKWAFVKLANHVGRDAEEYRRAWRLNGLEEADVPRYLRNVSEFCEEHEVPYLVPLPFSEKVYAWRGEVLQVQIAGAIYLVHSQRTVYELDEAAQVIAAQIDGIRSVSAISAAFAAAFQLEPEVAAYRAGELLHRLEHDGLIVGRSAFVTKEEC